jgi:hypothetical protein
LVGALDDQAAGPPRALALQFRHQDLVGSVVKAVDVVAAGASHDPGIGRAQHRGV